MLVIEHFLLFLQSFRNYNLFQDKTVLKRVQIVLEASASKTFKLSKIMKFVVERAQNKWNSLPNDKISKWFKFKAFADDKINVTTELKLVIFIGMEKNIVGKGQNAGYQHFLLFP